jgi:hypothetical protein
MALATTGLTVPPWVPRNRQIATAPSAKPTAKERNISDLKMVIGGLDFEGGRVALGVRPKWRFRKVPPLFGIKPSHRDQRSGHCDERLVAVAICL